ncbi:MAG: hypothetical protein JRH01_15990 [Deltaproteobacteria bacterium]|nr:hypothetical protein [Deltaproteobacteria bacterium]
MPVEETRTILTTNPAKLYGFDVDALQRIADRVGPSAEELLGAAPVAVSWPRRSGTTKPSGPR